MSPFKKQKVGVTILRESQWKELDKISKNANFRKIEKWKNPHEFHWTLQLPYDLMLTYQWSPN